MKPNMTNEEYIKAVWLGEIVPENDDELETAMNGLSKDYSSPFLIEREKQDEKTLNNYKAED